jgi:dehydrodolichyl diphosphate syntase complex subunit NUS1
MSQRGTIRPEEVSQELIDAEITESVMGEPDLLIIFGGRVVLEGYPPWQVRLTEICYARDLFGGVGVGYSVFLRGLYRFARAEFRFGR